MWLATLVTPTQDSSLRSNVSPEEAEWIMSQLQDLRAFLEKNAQFVASAEIGRAQQQQQQAGQHQMHAAHQQRSQQEALLRERQSLLFLQHLVSHSLQVSVALDHGQNRMT